MCNIFKIVIQISLIVIVFSACTKYPDGPSFSLAAKKTRVVGKWKLDKFYINGIDKTETFSVFYMNIERQGTYNFHYSSPVANSYCEEGDWKFTDRKQDLTFTYEPADNSGGFGCGPILPGTYTYEIRRLKAKQLWLRRLDTNGDILEFHFKSYIRQY